MVQAIGITGGCLTCHELEGVWLLCLCTGILLWRVGLLYDVNKHGSVPLHAEMSQTAMGAEVHRDSDIVSCQPGLLTVSTAAVVSTRDVCTLASLWDHTGV